jgi:hypothetical protein
MQASAGPDPPFDEFYDAGSVRGLPSGTLVTHADRSTAMARAEFSDWDVWSFKKNDDTQWIWQRHSPDGQLLVESRTAFEQLKACQEDATRFGYVLPQGA